jgi:hypothetical protein
LQWQKDFDVKIIWLKNIKEIIDSLLVFNENHHYFKVFENSQN